MQIYNEGGTVKTMAEKAEISHSGFVSWMKVHGLKVHANLPPRVRPDDFQGHHQGPPYIQDRPEWERDNMRQFLSRLVSAADTFPTLKPDVGSFLDAYQAEYGCKHNYEEVLHG